MTKFELQKKLLSDRRVIDEIHRHQWLESEKAGRDIGFETAAVDWLNRFSTAWMKYHMPRSLSSREKSPIKRRGTPRAKRRSAKSYH